jgi:transcriptional regulator with GAF, ATPase, and Fis domain
MRDSAVSRHHATLHFGPLRLEDAGSANGTFIDHEKLKAGVPVPIRAGQGFLIGGAVLVLQGVGEGIDDTIGEKVLGRPPSGRELPDGVIAHDPGMRSLFALAARVAQGNINVLILGETGAGKELVAEAIHHASPRRDHPLVRLNCAALPEQLLESELFGYERGAFTGAVSSKPGLIESANGGTVFLDEVGELTPVVQAKVLRVIEMQEVQRLGSVRARPVDVRFVSATNRNLAMGMSQGTFRTDLFFRLNGACLEVPPLRSRPKDVLPLAEAFVMSSAKRLGLRFGKRLSSATQRLLLAHAWPGNVRELRNAIDRAVLLSSDHVIEPSDLGITLQPEPMEAAAQAPSAVISSSTPTPPRGLAAPAWNGVEDAADAPRESERQRILDALKQCSGNQTRAAKLLAMPRRTLVRKLSLFGFPRPRKPS